METVNTCRFVKIVFLIIVLFYGSARSEIKTTNVESSVSNKNDTPTSVDKRFFDFGSLMNQFFPGMNQGGQGGYSRAPGIPNDQGYFPGNQNQSQGYERPQQQERFPVIDDAKTYPGKGRVDTNQVNFFGPQQSQYPNQGNGGGYVQNPGPGNGPPYFDGVNVDLGNQYQNPNNQHFGRPNQINIPPNQQYPNQNNYGNQYPPQGIINGGQYPNQGNYGGSPMQYPGPAVPDQSNFGNQYPNPGPVNGGPYQSPGLGYPSSPPLPADQSNFGNQFPNSGPVNGGRFPEQGAGSSFNQFPNSRPTIPNQNNFGNQYQNPGIVNGGQGVGGGGIINQYPQLGNFPPDQPNFNQDGGTIDSIAPPEQNGFLPDNQNNNAVLGKPVTIPMTTFPPGQIVYPQDREEDPPKKQCAQDCQTSSEYNPLCGSNGVTYYNPGRFYCARNCGINVFVMQKGRCASEVITRNPVKTLI